MKIELKCPVCCHQLSEVRSKDNSNNEVIKYCNGCGNLYELQGDKLKMRKDLNRKDFLPVTKNRHIVHTGHVLHVKKDGRCFYVIAEHFYSKYNSKHLDSKTKKFLEPYDVKYRLIELEDGKPKGTIGFISDVQTGSQILKVKKTTHKIEGTPAIIEYDVEFIFIIEKVFNF